MVAPCIVAIRGTRGCELVGDVAMAQTIYNMEYKIIMKIVK